MSPTNNKIALIGAGNVATQLGLALQHAGCTICQVYSRTEASAKILAEKLYAPFTTDEKGIVLNADIYIFMLKDDALPEVLGKMNPVNGLCVHTSGSLSMDVFKDFSDRFGVFYPLQTFSKATDISLCNVPIFVESNSKHDEETLFSLAKSLSDSVRQLSSDQRKYIHLAAVFACNFTNHMYTLAYEILREQNLPEDVLLPLIEETASKIKQLPPREAQTGPAVRYDKTIINKHLQLLAGENKKEIYQLISKSIHKTNEDN